MVGRIFIQRRPTATTLSGELKVTFGKSPRRSSALSLFKNFIAFNSNTVFQRPVSVAQSVSASDCYSANREVDSSILSGDDFLFFGLFDS